MALLKETEFKREFSSNPKSLYYILGEEKYLVCRYTKWLVDKITGKKPTDFDFHKLNAETTVQTIADLTEQFPMYSEKNCIVLSDYNINTLSESDFQSFMQICSDLPDTTVLILTQPTLICDSKKAKTAAKEKKFRALAEKCGTVLELNKKDNPALCKQLVSWAEEQNCTLSLKLAEQIIFRCGNDMTTLRKEMDKLCAYCLESDITPEAVAALVPQNIEAKIFSLSTAIIKYDLNETFNQLHALFDTNEKPEVIIAVLSSAFIDMYRMRVAEECGKTLQDVMTDFDYKKNREFVLKNARSNARRFSKQALHEIIDILSETDIQLKSTRADAAILIETLAARLIVITHKENTH